MMRWKLTLNPGPGLLAERFALRYLKQQGLRLKNKNYACRFGEIDLVMQDVEHLVFIEVRFRSFDGYGRAEETIDFRKRRKVTLTAKHYLQSQSVKAKLNYRFDVVIVRRNTLKKLEAGWIKNAW